MNTRLCGYLRVCLIALMCGARFQAYGDEAKDVQNDPKSLPNIVINWAPAFDKGYINLSITNNTDHTLNINGVLHPEFLYVKDAAVTVPKDFDRDVIEPIIVFFAAPGHHGISGHGVSGSYGAPPIAPGETKEIKLLSPDGSIISMAQGANKVILSLTFNGQELAKTRIVMTNIANEWKVEK